MTFNRKKIQFCIFIIDFALLFLSLYLAIFARRGELSSAEYYLEHILLLIPMFISWPVCMYVMNFYSIDTYRSFFKDLWLLFITAIISTLIGFSSFYLFGTSVLPKTVLVFQSGIFILLSIIWHSLSRLIFSNKKTHSNYAFIGYNKTVDELLTLTKTKFLGNFIPKAIFDDKNTIENSELKNFKEKAAFKRFIEEEKISTFILSPEYPLSKELSEVLFDQLNHNATFYSLPDFFELIARKIPLGAINETWILSNISYSGKFIFHAGKRLFDLLVSLILLPFTLVLFPFIALSIKLESKGPVFFTQKRLGQYGKVFNLYKFRTMRTENNDGAYTTKNDSRITKTGNFMRKTRIDELPQLLNIIRGDMSLIGPRPERPELAVDLQKAIPYYNQRLIVKPGITGWDQASGEYHSPSVEDTYKKLQNDLYYVKNQGFALDFSIFFKTIRTVFAKEGM